MTAAVVAGPVAVFGETLNARNYFWWRGISFSIFKDSLSRLMRHPKASEALRRSEVNHRGALCYQPASPPLHSTDFKFEPGPEQIRTPTYHDAAGLIAPARHTKLYARIKLFFKTRGGPNTTPLEENNTSLSESTRSCREPECTPSAAGLRTRVSSSTSPLQARPANDRSP